MAEFPEWSVHEIVANTKLAIDDASLRIAHAALAAIDCYAAPSAIYRPKLFLDGNKWCALYGDNFQDGVAGFGDSPAIAMGDFDNQWIARLSMKHRGTEPAGSQPAAATDAEMDRA